MYILTNCTNKVYESWKQKKILLKCIYQRNLIIILMDTSELWSDASHFLVSAPDLSFKLNQVLFYLNIIISNNINITTNNWYIIRYKCFSFSRIISPPFLYFEREAPEVQMYLYYYNTRKCLLQIARFFILKAKKNLLKSWVWQLKPKKAS